MSMDAAQLTARAQWWSGWCLDHEEDTPDLGHIRLLLDAVVAHLKDDRDARLIAQVATTRQK